MIDFFGNSWVQMILWVFAASMTFYFDRFMKGANIAWTFIAFGILMIGIRIGYKLLPFYGQTQVVRYGIGIVGIICLFIGLLSYYNSTLKPLMRN
jgi:hypothetical protein